MMKNENSERISLERAKFLAKQEAYSELKDFIQSKSHEVLDNYYLEAEHCWIFFKHPSIVIPKNRLYFRAFAVGDQGGCRLVYDLRDEPDKMQKHLSDLSNYFRGNKE